MFIADKVRVAVHTRCDRKPFVGYLTTRHYPEAYPWCVRLFNCVRFVVDLRRGVRDTV